MWYDRKAKNYFAYDGKETKNITAKIKVPLYDEENDTPDYPSPYGVMGWQEDDTAVFMFMIGMMFGWLILKINRH